MFRLTPVRTMIAIRRVLGHVPSTAGPSSSLIHTQSPTHRPPRTPDRQFLQQTELPASTPPRPHHRRRAASPDPRIRCPETTTTCSGCSIPLPVTDRCSLRPAVCRCQCQIHGHRSLASSTPSAHLLRIFGGYLLPPESSLHFPGYKASIPYAANEIHSSHATRSTATAPTARSPQSVHAAARAHAPFP